LQFGSLTDEERESIMEIKEIGNYKNEETQIEEVKIISDIISEPLCDLDKCSFNELINRLQKFPSGSSFNIHQEGFGSLISYHVHK
jgi:hypothetical protein